MSSSRDLYSENRHYSRIIMDEPDDDEIEVVKGRAATEEYMREHTCTELFDSESLPDPDVPVEDIKYYVRRGPLTSTTEFWQVAFPRILDGLVDKRDYYKTIVKVNEITTHVCKKIWYTNGFLATMWISGSLLFVPIIPAIVLSVRKIKKIDRAIEEYFSYINTSAKIKGYKWVLQKDDTQQGRVGSIYIQFLSDENMVSHQKFWLVAHSGKVIHTAGPVML